MIEVIGEYVDAKTKIEHRCLIHDVVWMCSPTNILSGKRCPSCASEGRKKHNSLSAEEYIRKLHELSPHIDPLDSYINAKTPIRHYCNIHSMEFVAAPDRVLRCKCGCSECGRESFERKMVKPYKTYQMELADRRSNIQCIGKYSRATNAALHRCLVCETEWMAEPREILLGHSGCPQCRSNRRRTHAEYVTELERANPDIEVVESYINSYTSILHRCKKDGNIWKAAPFNILHNGTGCPKCNESRGEKAVRSYLETHQVIFVPQKIFKDCINKRKLRFDFYLPEYNTVIEYDGEQHFMPVDWFGGEKCFKSIQQRDDIKNRYCDTNGIRMLRIPYFEYRNIENAINNFLHN